MKSAILLLSSVAVVLLTFQIAECSDMGDLETLLDKLLETKKTHLGSAEEKIDKALMERVMNNKEFVQSFTKGNGRGEEYFSSIDTCPTGNVMFIKPFKAIIYPRLHDKGVIIEPEKYEPCTVLIDVPEGERVYFLYIASSPAEGDSCDDGQLDIYDGPDAETGTLFLHLCGNTMPSLISSKTNQVFLSYTPGKNYPNKGGFFLYYINSGSEVVAEE